MFSVFYHLDHANYFTLLGRVQIVKFLLKKLSLESITRISKNSDTGWSVLHEAASRDQSSVLQVFLVCFVYIVHYIFIHCTHCNVFIIQYCITHLCLIPNLAEA